MEEKEMKKFVKLFVVLVTILLIIPIKVFANENSSLFSYTTVDNEVESYAKDNVAIYMSSHYDNNVEDYELGKGITVFSKNNQNKTIFPIWENNRIIATFVVENDSEGFYAVYSEAYVDQFNYLATITSSSSPMYVVASNNSVYGVVDNRWYDLNHNTGIYAVKEPYSVKDKIMVNSFEKLDFVPYIQTRIPTSYSKSFSIYYTQTGSYCYSYALGNLLRNMGYTSYTPTDIQKYMNNSLGASKTDLSNYLQSKGLSCNYANSGYLSFEDVMSIIYYNNNYIYIGAKSNTRNESHAFVIYGYFDNGITQLYNFWNPWYNYKQTMSAGNRIIETASSETFTWNNGYLYNIR